MKRLLVRVALLTAVVACASSVANAQLRSMSEGGGPRDNKTGRTDDGLKADAEIDRLYRAKAGQQTPNPKADPWGDVRATQTPAAQPPSKAKHKQP